MLKLEVLKDDSQLLLKDAGKESEASEPLMFP